MIHINFRPSTRDLRVFAIGQMVLAILIANSFVRSGMSPALAAVMLTVSIAIGLAGLFAPQSTRFIYVAWMLVMFPIGWIVSHLLLAAVFWIVVTPIGLGMRCLGVDHLGRRFDTTQTSYWSRRKPSPPAARYFRKF